MTRGSVKGVGEDILVVVVVGGGCGAAVGRLPEVSLMNVNRVRHCLCGFNLFSFLFFFFMNIQEPGVQRMG